VLSMDFPEAALVLPDWKNAAVRGAPTRESVRACAALSPRINPMSRWSVPHGPGCPQTAGLRPVPPHHSPLGDAEG
jgi:hypothetical protein